MFFFRLCKRGILLHILLTDALLFFTIPNSVFSQHTDHRSEQILPLNGDSYYIIVGAFQIQANANKFRNAVINSGFPVKVGKNVRKDLNYVYVYSSQDFESAKSSLKSVRAEEVFKDAWIYYEPPNENSTRAIVEQNEIVQTEPRDTPAITEPSTIEEKETISQNTKTEQSRVMDLDDLPAELIYEPSEELKKNGFKYVVNTVNRTTFKEAKGLVTIVDFERNKVLTEVPSNQVVYIPRPGTTSDKILIITNVFGYKSQQIDLVVDDPIDTVNAVVSTIGDTTYVSFELVRMRPGDIFTMYQVYFYSNSSVMKRESRFQLYQLLDMLKEDELVRIRLHGHTNSKASGEIIYPLQNQYFNITPANERKNGSAKKLSLERCVTIKDWLISKGIDGDRIDVKGWGGKKMLYDKFSNAGKKNIRVEVEVLNASDS